MLSNVRIVLVDTTHPGNIGATARAMKNMCLERLVLVNPQHYPSAEATARASGADDTLAAAQQFATLDAALAGCSLVFGASARIRSIAWPQTDARVAAGLIVQEARQAPVAVVFGREHSGLTNEELDRCNYLLHIPVNPGYASLNLAAAVQVVAYEIFMASLALAPELESHGTVWASAEEVERFYAHLEKTLIALDFLDPAYPKHLMRRLRRLFNRTRLDQNEINILRGILTAVLQTRNANNGG